MSRFSKHTKPETGVSELDTAILDRRAALPELTPGILDYLREKAQTDALKNGNELDRRLEKLPEINGEDGRRRYLREAVDRTLFVHPESGPRALEVFANVANRLHGTLGVSLNKLNDLTAAIDNTKYAFERGENRVKLADKLVEIWRGLREQCKQGGLEMPIELLELSGLRRPGERYVGNHYPAMKEPDDEVLAREWAIIDRLYGNPESRLKLVTALENQAGKLLGVSAADLPAELSIRLERAKFMCNSIFQAGEDGDRNLGALAIELAGISQDVVDRQLNIGKALPLPPQILAGARLATGLMHESSRPVWDTRVLYTDEDRSQSSDLGFSQMFRSITPSSLVKGQKIMDTTGTEWQVISPPDPVNGRSDRVIVGRESMVLNPWKRLMELKDQLLVDNLPLLTKGYLDPVGTDNVTSRAVDIVDGMHCPIKMDFPYHPKGQYLLPDGRGISVAEKVLSSDFSIGTDSAGRALWIRDAGNGRVQVKLPENEDSTIAPDLLLLKREPPFVNAFRYEVEVPLGASRSHKIAVNIAQEKRGESADPVLADIVGMLGELPAAALRSVDRIYWYNCEPFYQGRGFRHDVAGLASCEAGERAIHVFSNGRDMRVMAHETGHTFADYVYGNTMPDAYYSGAIARDSEIVSSYGQSGRAEDYAEAFEAFLCDRSLRSTGLEHRFREIDRDLQAIAIKGSIENRPSLLIFGLSENYWEAERRRIDSIIWQGVDADIRKN